MEVQADCSGRELAAGVSKALEELVASMRSVLERLQDEEAGAPGGGPGMLALRLKSAVHHGEQLFKCMQAYAGAQHLIPTRVEALPFLCDMAHGLRKVLDDRIDVAVVVGHDCPPCCADSGALEEALMHLVSNARDAMPDGGRLRLSARADTSSDGHRMVAISISDNGVGMSPEFAPRAALPFVTTKNARAQAGTGLAAVDGFAHQSGGHLSLLSQTGAGMIATLSLPEFMVDASQAAH